MQHEDDDHKVRVTNERIVFDDFFRIKAAEVSIMAKEGRWTPQRQFLSFERGDAVAAVVTDPDREVAVLIRQFRYPAMCTDSGWLLELVAGMLPEGETPENAIRREINEEIGYTPVSLTPISIFYTSPGGSSERIFLFHVEIDLDTLSGEGGGLPGSGEVIETVTIPFKKVFEYIDGGEIVDAKTLVGLMWLRMQNPAIT